MIENLMGHVSHNMIIIYIKQTKRIKRKKLYFKLYILSSVRAFPMGLSKAKINSNIAHKLKK